MDLLNDTVDDEDLQVEPLSFRARRIGRRFYRKYTGRRLVDPLNPLEVYSADEVHELFRLRPESISDLTGLIIKSLCRPKRAGSPIPPVIQVCIFLRFLATGSFHAHVADTVRVHTATVCRIVHRVAAAIEELAPDTLCMPRGSQIRDVKEAFRRVAGIPDVVGCIGCTHVRLMFPTDNSEMYRNTDGQYSLNVQIVCGADSRIFNIEANWPGSTNNYEIYQNSNLAQVYMENFDGVGYLLGDRTYPCSHRLLAPYGSAKNQHQQRYQAAHERTYRLVRQTIEDLKSRFGALRTEFRLSSERTSRMVLAAAFLHNFALARQDGAPQPAGEPPREREMKRETEDDGEETEEHDDENGQAMRETVAKTLS